MEITKEQRERLGAMTFGDGCKNCEKNLIQLREILKEIDKKNG